MWTAKNGQTVHELRLITIIAGCSCPKMDFLIGAHIAQLLQSLVVGYFFKHLFVTCQNNNECL